MPNYTAIPDIFTVVPGKSRIRETKFNPTAAYSHNSLCNLFGAPPSNVTRMEEEMRPLGGHRKQAAEDGMQKRGTRSEANRN